MRTILIIDDDEELSDVLSLTLTSDSYEVRTCAKADTALSLVGQNRFSLLLLDLRLGDTSGTDLLPKLRELDPNVPVLMITAHGDVESAVKAFKLGATGYIQKPFQEGDLKAQIAHAIENYEIHLQIQPLSLSKARDPIRKIVSSLDPIMDAVCQKIAIAAEVNSSVVITGESGTGKELVAKALHQCGTRKSGPFIAFNCSALPETLIESELFGHVRGAFTDAREAKAGLFTRATGGTLFIDEIGDAPPSIQTKLLRVLQEREVLPIGGTSPIKVDVRIVTATHKSLQAEVAAGRFRQDLFYRLHVIPIHIPALRERPRDILFLASFFANRISGEMKLPFDGFTPESERALRAHAWPGNVRELQNRVEHALVVTRGGRIAAASLFPETCSGPDASESENVNTPGSDELRNALPTFFEAKHNFERSYLEKVLSVAKGNIAKTARLASKSRTEVYSLLKRHGLDPSNFK